MVEIFLNAAIASVLYTRQLLKHDSSVFAQRCVADLLDSPGSISYEDFLSLNTQAGKTRSQSFKMLLKGKSRKADSILALLEGGIFDALQSGYLEAVQLSICTDSNRPSEVVECYTFSFTYTRSPGRSSRKVNSMVVSPIHQTLFLIGDAQKSFNAAIKGLLKSIRGLPQLPRRRNVGLNLFYTDDCPESYEPKGFTNCIDDSLHFPGGPALATRSKKPCDLVAGAHSISVVVSHVDSIKDGVQMQVIPEDIEYINKRSRLDEYKVSTEQIFIPSPELSPQQAPLSSQPLLPSSIVPSAKPPSTQTREDIQTREALQQMQRSSSRPRDLIATQTLANESNADSGDFRVVEHSLTDPNLDDCQPLARRERMVVASKMAELIVHVKTLQNRCSTNDLPFDQEALDHCEVRRTRRSTKIRCECMDDVEEGVMLFCEVCSSWQHQSCYGWDTVDEKDRPVSHFCYGCLLLPGKKDLSDWMPTLVGCRNVLKYLYANGFGPENNDNDMMKAAHLRCDPRNLKTNHVMRALVRDELIDIGHKRRIIERNRQRGMSEYVDPLASISHLYEIRSHEETEAPLEFTYKHAVQSLELAHHGVSLDAIRTRDPFGNEVVRYGYYPRLATARNRRKRPASVVMGSDDLGNPGAGHGEGFPNNKTARTTSATTTTPRRKMSRSEMVCFDETSSETHADADADVDTTAVESTDEDDLYD